MVAMSVCFFLVNEYDSSVPQRTNWLKILITSTLAEIILILLVSNSVIYTPTSKYEAKFKFSHG